MTCEGARAALPACALGSPKESEAAAIEAHLAACPGCAKEWVGARALSSALDGWQAASTPPGRREAVLAQIAALLEAEKAAGFDLRKVTLSFISGIALAFLGMGSLNRQVDLRAFSAFGVSSCAVLWSGLFVGAFYLILGRYRLGGIPLSPIASIGAASAGLLLVGTAFCPKLEFLQLWLASLPGRLLADLGGAGLSTCAFGALFALAPSFLAALYFGRKLHGPPWKESVLASGAIVLLLAPGLALQCSRLRLALAALLVAGVILGSLGGTLAALRLQHGAGRPA